MLLSISRIYRYQDSIYSFIKNLIIDGYKNIDRVKYIKWIDTSQISDLASPDLFIQSITQVIATNSQHISEGILAIGFILLDSEKIVAGRSCNDSLPYQSTKRVGFNILLQLYDSLPLCRCAIVDGLIDRIESRNGSMSLEILLDISTRDNFYQDHFNKVKNLLTYLTEIGLDSSKQILLILSPHIDSTLQNLLLLQFRKNIFSRILENRTVALYGYQFLLNHDSTSLETRREITLIICNLLNHHETLNEIYLVFNSISVPELIDQVFESLIAHLKKYIDNGLITVSSSVSETDATITNHLYNLIETVCKLARISKCPEKLSAIEKICKQFANSTVFAHGFDMADSDFSSSSLIGKINLRRVQLIQGIIFKFVEHCLSIKKLDLVHSLIVLNLAFEKASKDKDKWELKGVSFDVCCDWIYNGELKEDSMTRFIALNLLEAVNRV